MPAEQPNFIPMDQIMVDVRKRKTLPTFVPAEPSGLDQPNISRTTAADFPDGQFELPITELDLFRQGNVSIHIMGTEWCNLKCPHCYAPYAPDRGMTANQIDHVVNEVEATGLEKYWYDLSGGEIMGNREWPQIFDRLLSTGKDVSVNTNGTLVTDENVGILKDLDTRYPDKLFLSVSLDSEDPETNEKTRPEFAERDQDVEAVRPCFCEDNQNVERIGCRSRNPTADVENISQCFSGKVSDVEFVDLKLCGQCKNIEHVSHYLCRQTSDIEHIRHCLCRKTSDVEQIGLVLE
jgi:organic radical activating enzyme